MPELPEVETIARGLHKRVAGDTIESIWLGSKPQTMKSHPREIAATLEHTRIARVRRMGKHIVFDLERDGVGRAPSPAHSSPEAKARAKTSTKAAKKSIPLGPRSQWIVHLGMTGRLLVTDPKQEIVKHTHAVATLRRRIAWRNRKVQRYAQAKMRCQNVGARGSAQVGIGL